MEEVIVSPRNMQIKALFWVEPKSRGDFTYIREQIEEIANKLNLPFVELDLDKY